MTVFEKQRKPKPRFLVRHEKFKIGLVRSTSAWGTVEKDVTEHVVDLFRRILELSAEEDRAKVKANAREHFGIEFG